MNYAYYRVSTDKQDYESQKVGVLEYCNRRGITIDKEILDDGVSGTVEALKRRLGYILRTAKPGDTIITSELSRLGRNTADVLKTCSTLVNKQVSCYFVKQNMGIDTSPMGKMMIAILAAFSEMERDLISQRTKEGLARVKASGKKLGRPAGSKNKISVHDILTEKMDKIKKLVEEHNTIKSIAKKMHVSNVTMQRFIKKNSISRKG